VDPTVILSTFGLIFVAELGDKSQLTAMALAARYPWRRVFLGAACAFVVLNVAAVGIGRVLFELLPLHWIQLAAGLLFLYFGASTLRHPEDEEQGTEPRAELRGPATTTFLLILVGEIGDKTQLATAGLAAQHAAPGSVFVGSTLALWAVSLLGVLVGGQITRVLPIRIIHRIAGLLFLVFGAAILYQAWRNHAGA